MVPIDGHSARMTLRQDGPPVSAVVDIDDEGKLTCIRWDRYRHVGGKADSQTRYRSQCRDSTHFAGDIRSVW